MRIKPILSAGILALLVLLSSAAFGETLRVSIRKAPIRKGPGSTTELVTMVTEGTLLELVDRDGLWYIVRVSDTGMVGYIHSALVDFVEAPRTMTQPQSPRRPVTTPPPPPSPSPSPMRSEPVREPSPPPPPPPTREPARDTSYSSSSQDSTSEPDYSTPWDTRGFGVGFRTGFSTLGTLAFNMRTWGDSAGLSFDLSYLSVGEFADLQMFPSVLFKIGGPIEIGEVYLQPYAGAGANVVWHRNQEQLLDEKFNLSAAGLGGLDVGFMHIPNLTVSTDIDYFSKSFYGYETESDIGLTVGLNWYFK